ncbi:hypothetical protein N0D50_001706 [Salmonella enterica]|nr:hypothetical protein [Salmonella enterica]
MLLKKEMTEDQKTNQILPVLCQRGVRLCIIVFHVLITGPAVIFFITMFVSTRGNAAKTLLHEAETMLRTTPEHHVFECKLSHKWQDMKRDERGILYAPQRSSECQKVLVSSHTWIDDTNSALLAFYRVCVITSLMVMLLISNRNELLGRVS